MSFPEGMKPTQDNPDEIEGVMAKADKEAPAGMGTENPADDPLLDLDSFMTTDDVSAAWVNGLMIWLTPRGGWAARPLSAWRAVLAEYQALR